MPTPTGSPLLERCLALSAAMKLRQKPVTSRWLTHALENALQDIDGKTTTSSYQCAQGATDNSIRDQNVRSMRSTRLMRQLWLSACICDGVKVI